MPLPMSVLASAIGQVLGLPLSPTHASMESAVWAPTQWFLANEQGIWLDPSDFSTMFQDSAGTTPVTAVEQPVGLILDRRLGLVEGSELVANGTFDTSTTGWVAGNSASLSVVGQKLRVQHDGTNYPLAGYNLSTVAGKTYRARFSVARGTSPNGIGLRVLNLPFSFGGAQLADSGYKTASGDYECVFTALSSVSHIYAIVNTTTAGTYDDIDNISVRELPGNHAMQATAASRPVLSARKNKLLATATLATQSVTLTASAHTLSFKGTGTVTLSGASTAGPLVGTGASNRVSLTFTPTAGSVTFTVSGSVTDAQLENGSAATTYQRVNTATNYDTVGFPHYLNFDGVDDFLVTGNINFTATHEMTVVAGVQSPKTSQGMLLELGTSYDSTFPSFVNFVPNTADGKIFAAYHDAAGYGSYSTAAGVAINANVIAYSFDTAATTVSGKYPRFHLNGVNGMPSDTSPVAASAAFINAPLYIGRRAGTSTPFLGNLYQLVVRGAATTTPDLVLGETYTAKKTGVTL